MFVLSKLCGIEVSDTAFQVLMRHTRTRKREAGVDVCAALIRFSGVAWTHCTHAMLMGGMQFGSFCHA